jgi:hypothetical protein
MFYDYSRCLTIIHDVLRLFTMFYDYSRCLTIIHDVLRLFTNLSLFKVDWPTKYDKYQRRILSKTYVHCKFLLFLKRTRVNDQILYELLWIFLNNAKQYKIRMYNLDIQDYNVCIGKKTLMEFQVILYEHLYDL